MKRFVLCVVWITAVSTWFVIPTSSLVFASFAKSTTVARTSDSKRVRKIAVVATAYCPCKLCCGSGAKGITKLGDDAWVMDGVAADFRLFRPRTRIAIPGFGVREIDDTGGAMRRSARRGMYHIDIRMASHSKALEFASKLIEVRVMPEPKKP